MPLFFNSGIGASLSDVVSDGQRLGITVCHYGMDARIRSPEQADMSGIGPQ
jgi:hypothetical protein